MLGKYYIVSDGYIRETFINLSEAEERYEEWCCASEFVEITDNSGASIARSW